MLVASRELLLDAHRNNYAVGGFNVYNLEQTVGVIRAAEKNRAPVILQLLPAALRFRYAPVVALNIAAAQSASVPVAVHLDHCPELPEVVRALHSGFTSVMIDGSHLPFEANVELTRQAVEAAHGRGASVEAELGRLAGREEGELAAQPPSELRSLHPLVGEATDPAQAAEFVERTGVDALAVCVGNVHGFYPGEPQIELGRLEAIRSATPVPLVLHGASGLPDEVLQRIIERGVVKFNLNTELRVAYFVRLREELDRQRDAYDLSRLMQGVSEATEALVSAKLRVLGSRGRS